MKNDQYKLLDAIYGHRYSLRMLHAHIIRQ